MSRNSASSSRPHAQPGPEALGNPRAIDTEIVRLRTELGELRQVLEHHERLATLGTIAGLIAHELNNILTPVCSYSQMALDAPDDRLLSRKALERSLAGAERASRISAAILGFVRDDGSSESDAAAPRTRGSDVCCKSGSSSGPNADNADKTAGHCGCASIHHKPPSRASTPEYSCDVSTALDDALLCVARDAARDGIKLERNVPDGLAAAIRPIALQHVLINLILNARNAMVRTGGTLTVEGRVCDDPPRPGPGEVCSLLCSTWNTGAAAGLSSWDGAGIESASDPHKADALELARANLTAAAAGASRHAARSRGCVVIEVRDAGRGMDADRLSHIFRPFFSAPAPDGSGRPPREYSRSSERRTGTGLGMTVCKRLIEEAGGYLLIRSEPNRGTQVSIVLGLSERAMRQAS